jgi:2'-5' RNA ligase
MADRKTGLRARVRPAWARRGASRASTLLVPVPEAELVYERWSGKPDLVGTPGLPLHVTVLYPFLAPSAINAEVERELEALARAHRPFSYRLTDIGRFPNVLYLKTSPAGWFVELTQAVQTRWPSHPPYGDDFDEIIPHVTLARGDEPAGLAAAVEPILPIDAVARELLLVSASHGTWIPRARFRLGG